MYFWLIVNRSAYEKTQILFVSNYQLHRIGLWHERLESHKLMKVN
jgi:hypothetical protein